MDTLPIINRSYEAYKNIVDLNLKLNKRWRHSLGISFEQTVLDLIEQLVMAKNAPKPLKAGYLLKANGKLEVARLKLRLILEFRLSNVTGIFQLQAKLDEVGKMLGGWLKSLYNQ
ncbi:MAG: four helix bundle protein [Candidatus Peregrinibacteria bacterium]